MRTTNTNLFAPPFVALLLIAYLGFAQYHVLQAVLPVLVITQGGDATIAGIVVAVHSLPSVVFRPPVGWVIDRIGIAIVLMVAGFLVAVSGFAYFLPGIGLLLFARFLHGTAWSAFSAAGHATLVHLAPPLRRAEAAGFYNLMAGVAQTTMPAAAFALIGISGFFGGLALSAACGVAAFVVVVLLVRNIGRDRPPSAVPGHGAGTERSFRRRVGDVLLEPAVLRPLVIEVMYSAVQPLFLAFAPVYALAVGVPLELMPIYFLSYGTMLIAARLILGTRADRHGRLTLIRSGVSISIAALLAVVLWPGFEGLLFGGALFAVATTLVSPTTMALTMDLAPAGRMGSAMATYTLGFPLATGGSAALWGLVITVAGYPTPFLVGAVLHATLLVLLFIFGRRLTRGPGERVT
jgi:MFS family permease